MMRQIHFFACALLACSIAGAQQLADVKVEKVAGDFQFTEGPVWSRDGYLLFSDIPAGKILRLTPGQAGTEVYRGNTNGANGNAFDTRGRLYSCEGSGRRVVRIDRSGKVEVLAERFEGKRLNQPNDIVVRRDGHVYFTDPAFGSGDRERELDFYGVYHISPRGELELIAKPKGRPNGVALSPDGRILYVDNTDERNVRAYDLDHGGRASNEHVLISGISGSPDGMKVDESGNLYVAAGAIEIYAPDGRHLGTIKLPETPANCAFGDADFQTLYVTARTSLYRVRLNVKGSVQY
ncbi:MAG: SMP-30/gluconolactonase/LRE family protein [Bryobacteraceae bacterium]